jgi:hypothetical protein
VYVVHGMPWLSFSSWQHAAASVCASGLVMLRSSSSVQDDRMYVAAQGVCTQGVCTQGVCGMCTQGVCGNEASVTVCAELPSSPVLSHAQTIKSIDTSISHLQPQSQPLHAQQGHLAKAGNGNALHVLHNATSKSSMRRPGR